MKKRVWKFAALISSGSCLMAVGGCSAVIVDLIVQQSPLIVAALLNAILGSASSSP